MSDEYCHYHNAAEREIHRTDVQRCTNCDVPVCSTCRTAGLCKECQPIKNDPVAMQDRSLEMRAYYQKMRKAGLA